MDVTIKYLNPNQQYEITLWSFDASEPAAGVQIADWSANGNSIKDGYSFSSPNAPTNNAEYQFSFFVTSDDRGKIVISGRRNIASSPTAVFLNALKISVPSGPTIDRAPVGGTFFTQADLRLYVLATGTGPFSYQWYKDSQPIDGANDYFIQLSNLQTDDSGTYSVLVGDTVTSTNVSAVVTVVDRPAPPSTLAIDFNNRGEETNTEPGFDSFVLDGAGATALATTHLFGGVEVTVAGSNGTSVDSRHRLSITNNAGFTQQNLLSDFIFSTLTTNSEGIDVTVRFLLPNQAYTVTVWSFDDQNPGTRTSDWYANNIFVNTYSFEGSTASEPTDNSQYRFTFTATTDANGTLTLQGRRNPATSGIAVFLNGLRIAIPETRISNVERAGGMLRLTVQTPDATKAHGVQEKSDLAAPTWNTVSGVTTTILSPTSVQLEFVEPGSGTHFYRVNRAP
jgi:hypothetical protein